MWRRIASGLLLFLILAVAAEAHGDELDRIRERGRVRIGIKSDYPPFGQLRPDGSLVGFDADLAALVARAIGVQLDLVAVNTTNRLQKLDQDAVDVVIATLADTARRREIATIVEPSYYASGVNILVPKSLQMADWPQLRGRTVCATQGAYYNGVMAQDYLLDLLLFNGTRDAKLALADRRCAGWLYDEPALVQTLQDPAWSDYHLPLKPVLVVPWGIALRRGPETASLARLIGDLVAGWHRDGTLIDLERKWGLPASAFLARQRELWQRRDASGAYLCARRADDQWPAECRNPAFVTASETSGLTAVGLALRQRTGLDITILYDPFERALFLRGVLVTLGLILASAGGSILFGALAAAVADARLPLVSRAVLGFTTFARMTPPLLQIYVIFFGVGGLLVSRLGVGLGAFEVAALCLAVYAGSANVAALLDAAAVLRLREPGARVGPRALGALFRLTYPAVMANTVNIIKATGMASAVAVPEVINASTSILAEHDNGAVMMNLLMVVYFLLVFGAVRAVGAVERRVGARVAG